MTPLQAECHQRHKRFHQAIAERAALVPQRSVRTYVIPNTPFGVAKVQPRHRPEPPVVHRMWFEYLIAEAMRHFRRPSVAEVIKFAALHFQVSRADLMRGGRTKELVLARHITMYVAKELTFLSLPEIGRRFGGFDHTSILHACQKISHRVERDQAVAANILAIRNHFAGRA